MLIFVSSIGRSGTKFLSEIVENCTDIKGYHVPKPTCNGSDLIKYNNNIYTPILQTKKNTIKKNIKNEFYFESSPLFLRCFIDKVIEIKKETNIPIGVIHLTRHPLMCAKSYMNRNSIPGNKKNIWRLPMTVKNNFLSLSTDKMNSLEKNLWDWFENEIRFHHHKHLFDKVYDFYFEDLNNEKKISSMFDFFGLKYNNNKLFTSLNENKLNKNKNLKKTMVSDSEKLIYKNFLDKIPYKSKEIFHHSYYEKYKII